MDIIKKWIGYNAKLIPGENERICYISVIGELMNRSKGKLSGAQIDTISFTSQLELTKMERELIGLIYDAPTVQLDSIIIDLTEGFIKRKELSPFDEELTHCIEKFNITHRYVLDMQRQIKNEIGQVSAKIMLHEQSLFMSVAYTIKYYTNNPDVAIKADTAVKIGIFGLERATNSTYLLGAISKITYAELLNCTYFINSYIRSFKPFSYNVLIPSSINVIIFVNGEPFDFVTCALKQHIKPCKNEVCTFANCTYGHSGCDCKTEFNQHHIAKYHLPGTYNYLHAMNIIGGDSD